VFGSLKPLLAMLCLLAVPALAATPAQCKAGCKTEIKPQCEKACRKYAAKSVDSCLKDMCEVAMKRCDKMCDDTPPKGK